MFEATNDNAAEAQAETPSSKARGIRRRAQIAAEAETADNEMDQIKTKTRRDLSQPLQTWSTFFPAPVSAAARKAELKALDDQLLDNIGRYLRLAHGTLGNSIEIESDEDGSGAIVHLILEPRTPHQLFELAYAIADSSRTYGGAPVVLQCEGNAWAIKERRWQLVVDYLKQIPAETEHFGQHKSQMSILISRANLLQKTAAKYSKQRTHGSIISLAQVQLAHQQEEAALTLFSNICQRLPKQPEEKQTATMRPRGFAPG